jgi:aquaporin Z
MKKQLLAEAFGTMMLVMIGCGAIALDEETGGAIGHTNVCIIFGVVVTILVFSLSHISSCHINPSVSIALWLEKRFEGKKVLPYIGAQIAGAIIGSVILKMIFPSSETLGTTLPKIATQSAFTIELVISSVLFSSILLVTHYTHKVWVIALTIGAIVFILAYIAGPQTGASMNPARSIGPAIASGNYSALWVYLLAPTLGMIIPGLLIAKDGVTVSR